MVARDDISGHAHFLSRDGQSLHHQGIEATSHDQQPLSFGQSEPVLGPDQPAKRAAYEDARIGENLLQPRHAHSLGSPGSGEIRAALSGHVGEQERPAHQQEQENLGIRFCAHECLHRRR